MNKSVEECFEISEGYDAFRFALVAYIGSPLAICGIFSNSLLIVRFFILKFYIIQVFF